MYTHLGSDLGKGAKHPTKKQTNRVKTTSFVCILRVNCVKLSWCCYIVCNLCNLTWEPWCRPSCRGPRDRLTQCCTLAHPGPGPAPLTPRTGARPVWVVCCPSLLSRLPHYGHHRPGWQTLPIINYSTRLDYVLRKSCQYIPTFDPFWPVFWKQKCQFNYLSIVISMTLHCITLH